MDIRWCQLLELELAKYLVVKGGNRVTRYDEARPYNWNTSKSVKFIFISSKLQNIIFSCSRKQIGLDFMIAVTYSVQRENIFNFFFLLRSPCPNIGAISLLSE